MRVSKLRIPFTLQQQAPDGIWGNDQSLWGSLGMSSGADYTHVSVVRAGELEINTGMRLVHDARIFLIINVDKIEERKRWVRLSLNEIKTLN